jgi:hypothetical protein
MQLDTKKLINYWLAISILQVATAGSDMICTTIMNKHKQQESMQLHVFVPQVN